DSSLFLLFRESSPQVWQRKVEWIAEQGGMVLLNVHPDYLGFEKDTRGGAQYPAAHYSELLRWLSEKYAGQYWHGLAADRARHCRKQGPSLRPRPLRRVCMLSASIYERDNRVLRYAESLAGRGDQVDVIAL